MFSTTPSVGMLSLRYIATARRVSASDTCCGVVTTIAPAPGTDWLRVGARGAVAERQVEDEVIETGPGHLAEELLERAVQHRAAPDDRRVVGGEEAHRD